MDAYPSVTLFGDGAAICEDLQSRAYNADTWTWARLQPALRDPVDVAGLRAGLALLSQLAPALAHLTVVPEMSPEAHDIPTLHGQLVLGPALQPFSALRSLRVNGAAAGLLHGLPHSLTALRVDLDRGGPYPGGAEPELSPGLERAQIVGGWASFADVVRLVEALPTRLPRLGLTVRPEVGAPWPWRPARLPRWPEALGELSLRFACGDATAEAKLLAGILESLPTQLNTLRLQSDDAYFGAGMASADALLAAIAATPLPASLAALSLVGFEVSYPDLLALEAALPARVRVDVDPPVQISSFTGLRGLGTQPLRDRARFLLATEGAAAAVAADALLDAAAQDPADPGEAARTAALYSEVAAARLGQRQRLYAEDWDVLA